MTEQFQIPKKAMYHLRFKIDGGDWVSLGTHEISIDENGTPTNGALDNIHLTWEADDTATPIIPNWIKG